MPGLGWIVRWRFGVVLALALTFGELPGSTGYPWHQGVDWGLLRAGSRALLGPHGYSAYAHVPGLQAGPLSLILLGFLCFAFGSAAPVVAHLLLYVELPVLMWLVEPCAAALLSRGRHSRQHVQLRVLVAGVMLAPVWAELAGDTAHVDDGLAVLAAVATLLFVVRDRYLAAALCAGSAAAAKPWAVGAFAVLLGLTDRRVRAAAIAVAIPVIAWLPEVIDPRNMHAATAAHFPVSADAPLRVLGLLPGVMPAWQRPVELAAVLAVAFVVAWQGRWQDALAASLLTRLLFEVSTLAYYDVDTLAAVILADVASRSLPWRSALLWVMVEVAGSLPTGLSGPARLVVLTLLVSSYTRVFSRHALSRARLRRDVVPAEPLLAS